jgi:hypothetical protein
MLAQHVYIATISEDLRHARSRFLRRTSRYQEIQATTSCRNWPPHAIPARRPTVVAARTPTGFMPGNAPQGCIILWRTRQPNVPTNIDEHAPRSSFHLTRREESRVTNFLLKPLGHFAKLRVCVKQHFRASPSCGLRIFSTVLLWGN